MVLDAGLFKYVWPSSYHQAWKGEKDPKKKLTLGKI